MSTIINPAPFQVELNSRKRSREDSQLSLESDEELDLLISGVPKRGHYADLLEYSSSSPESGITDMSSPSANGDSLDAHPKSCSVQPFSVNQFPRANATQAAIGGLVPTSSAEPQQQVLNKGYQLRIVDQPEENYRARYDSEGCRGPMKGRSGGYPTIELVTEKNKQWYGGTVKVELVGNDCIPLQSCLLDCADTRNVNKKLHPSEGLVTRASFENLRIRRLKKQDAKIPRSSGPKGGKMATKTKQDEKIAFLLFTVELKTDKQSCLILKAKSEAIYLNANHDPPEIHRIVPSYGSCHGGEQIVIVGTHMHSPKVSFFVTGNDGMEHELLGDIDKDVSHQNALVLHTPQIRQQWMMGNQAIRVKIMVTAGKGNRGGKDPLRSNFYIFTYVAEGTCKECFMRRCNIGIPQNTACGFTSSVPAPPAPPPMFTPITTPNLPAMYRPQSMQHVPQTVSVVTGPVKSPCPPVSPLGSTACSPQSMNYIPPVSVSSINDFLSSPNLSNHTSVLLQPSSAGQDDVLEELFEKSMTSSPPASAHSAQSFDISAISTSSPPSIDPMARQLEPSITDVMSYNIPDHSGPVSPEEMNCYLGHMAPIQECPPVSTSGFLTDNTAATLVYHQLQSNNV